MRVAILSDLHANLHALQAVAKDLEQAGVQETWCLGDVVGYGAHPREVLAWVEEHAALLVKGNHDQAVATGDVVGFNAVAASAVRYHAQVLTPPERTRLHDLPHEALRSVSRNGHDPASTLLVHGSPDDPLHEYVRPATAPRDLARWRGRADLVLLGHTHLPFVAHLRAPGEEAWRAEGFRDAATTELPDAPGLLVVNPGSVGQPRDDDARAAYAVVDFARRIVELRRVAYDVDAAAFAIRSAGLDPFLAQRLYRGA